MTNNWTIRSLLSWTTDYLKTAGIVSARLDAELLLSNSLGIRRIDLYLDIDRPVLEDERKKFKEMMLMRKKRVPIAYILGVKEFWSMEIEVDPAVLIPRPETETMIEMVLDIIPKTEPVTLLDLATGSGCIAIALAKEITTAHVWALDYSESALRIARRNAIKHKVCDRVSFLHSNWFEKLNSEYSEIRFDAILSNPPYIPDNEIDALEPEIRLYEPRIALEGGKDGIDAYSTIVRDSLHFLRSGGFLCVEIGYNSGNAVRNLFVNHGFSEVAVKDDLTGRERFVIGKKPERKGSLDG